MELSEIAKKELESLQSLREFVETGIEHAAAILMVKRGEDGEIEIRSPYGCNAKKSEDYFEFMEALIAELERMKVNLQFKMALDKAFNSKKREGE